MSTIFNVRNMRLPNVSRAALIIGSVVVVLAIIAGIVGWQLYKKLTNNSVVAYFPEALALYPGDTVQIMGVPVGRIDKIEPAGDKMKVAFHYENKYKVPANATATLEARGLDRGEASSDGIRPRFSFGARRSSSTPDICPFRPPGSAPPAGVGS